jgi:hypothetical protein
MRCIWWNENWQGKPKYLENPRHTATSSTTNPPRTRPGIEPGRPQWEADDLSAEQWHTTS